MHMFDCIHEQVLKNKRPIWCHLLFYFTSYMLNMFRTLIYLSYISNINSNTHRTKNNTNNVVIQQNSRKLLMIDILMSETCWAHKKWNKIASDIKLDFYSSTITMMHGPINIKFTWTSGLCTKSRVTLFNNRQNRKYTCILTTTKMFYSFCCCNFV